MNKSSQTIIAISLVLANLLTIWLFFASGGSIVQALWIYWLQSVVIGSIQIARIQTIPLRVSRKYLLSANTQKTGRYIMSGVFMFHYGFFHLIYAAFLFALSNPEMKLNIGSQQYSFYFSAPNVEYILLAGLAFAVHHTLSFISERRFFESHPESAPKIESVFMKPYSRIIPMHLIIIIGPAVAVFLGEKYVFALFMLLKTVADLALYQRGTSHAQPVNS